MLEGLGEAATGLIGQRLCINAALAGNVAELSQRFNEACLTFNATEAITTAAIIAGKLDSVRWLFSVPDPPCKWHTDAVYHAAECGRLDVLQFLLDVAKMQHTLDARLCWHASRHSECLKWLRQRDPPCPWDSFCFQLVAGRGDLDLLKWMQAQQPLCLSSPNMLTAAVMSGSLATVQWLCQQGVPWDSTRIEKATAHSAVNGDRVMLEWLHAANYPLHRDIAATAAAAGHLHLLIWLLDIGMMPTTPASSIGKGWPVSTLMLWGQRRLSMAADLKEQLCVAMATCCTFHGLIRWCERWPSYGSSSSSEPEQSSFLFKLKVLPKFSMSNSRRGQQLLQELAKLPHELLTKIAVAADLQYDMEEALQQQQQQRHQQQL